MRDSRCSTRSNSSRRRLVSGAAASGPQGRQNGGQTTRRFRDRLTVQTGRRTGATSTGDPATLSAHWTQLCEEVDC